MSDLISFSNPRGELASPPVFTLLSLTLGERKAGIFRKNELTVTLRTQHYDGSFSDDSGNHCYPSFQGKGRSPKDAVDAALKAMMGMPNAQIAYEPTKNGLTARIMPAGQSIPWVGEALAPSSTHLSQELEHRACAGIEAYNRELGRRAFHKRETEGLTYA
jgi:hypothetical protein